MERRVCVCVCVCVRARIGVYKSDKESLSNLILIFITGFAQIHIEWFWFFLSGQVFAAKQSKQIFFRRKCFLPDLKS